MTDVQHIPIIAEEHLKLAESCPKCGGFDGILVVDEARVRAISCADCGKELEVADTFELGPLEPVQTIQIPGMDSFVCCGNCRTYHDGRWPCPHCGHTA
jgi:Zn ribbon nucleic-acid-binding protein